VIGASAIGAQRPRLWPPIWRDAGYGVNAGPRDLLTTTSITLEATSGLQREPHSAAAPLSFGLDRQQRLENDNLIALPPCHVEFKPAGRGSISPAAAGWRRACVSSPAGPASGGSPDNTVQRQFDDVVVGRGFIVLVPCEVTGLALRAAHPTL
jgi:hypothetical protein